MKRYLVLLACVSAAAGSAYAQENVKTGPDRGGFTLLLTMGLGLQNDTGVQESAVGLGGLNLGIGALSEMR